MSARPLVVCGVPGCDEQRARGSATCTGHVGEIPLMHEAARHGRPPRRASRSEREAALVEFVRSYRPQTWAYLTGESA